MPGTWGFKGLYNEALEFPPGADVEVAPIGRARIRFNEGTGALQMSLTGGAYVDIGGGGGASPWVEAGSVVRLVTLTDQVVIGAALPVGSEDLRVVGDALLEGTVFVGSVITTPPASGSDLELESDTGDVHVTVGTNSATAFQITDGVPVLTYDSSGASRILTAGDGATPLDQVLVEATQATFDVGVDNAAFEVAVGADTYVKLDSSLGAETLGLGNATSNPTVSMTSGNAAVTVAAAVGAAIAMPDDEARGFAVAEAANDYIVVATTNAGPSVTVGNTTTNPTVTFAGSGEKIFANSGPIVLNERVGDPGLTANAGKLYTKDVAAVTELFYLDSSGAAVQLTSGGVVVATDIPIADNSATAFRVHEAANNYILINTTNAAEVMTLGNTLGAIAMAVKDDSATAFSLAEAANNYLVVATSNGTERITLGNTGATRPALTLQLPDNNATAFQLREAATDYLAIVTTDTAETITLGNTLASTTVQVKDNTASAFRLLEGANVYVAITTTDTAETITIGNTLTTIAEVMRDNAASGYSLAEGANSYMLVATTNGTERVTLGNTGAVRPAMTIQIPDNHATPFQLREAATDYLAIVTTDTAETMTLGNTLAAVTVNVKDNSSTAFRVLEAANAYITVSTANATERITFGNSGATTANYTFQIPDNVTTAFVISEAANAYLTVLSTNNNERVRIDGNAYLALAARGAAAAAATNEGALYTILVGGNTDLHYREPNTGSIMQLTAGGENYVSNAIQIPERGADPATVANAGKLYTKDVSTLTELFYVNSAGTVIQITSGSSLSRDFLMPDNTATAFRIREAANNYMVIATTNSAETITFGNTTTRQDVNFDVARVHVNGPNNGSSVFQVTDAGAAVYFQIDTTTATRLMTYGRNNGGTIAHLLYMKNSTGAVSWNIGGADEILNINATAGSEAFLWGNATANCPTHTFDLRDNKASAFLIQEGTNAYITCTTTNAAEVMTFGNTTAAGPQHVFNLRDNLSEALIVQEGANKYIVCTTTNGTEQVILAGGPAGSDVLIGNSTSNIGFYGSTGTTQIAIGANLTNNVTAGGVDSTIANFTDLTVYANDAATIRNDIYQLARSVKFLQDYFRAAGLST